MKSVIIDKIAYCMVPLDDIAKGIGSVEEDRLASEARVVLQLIGESVCVGAVLNTLILLKLMRAIYNNLVSKIK